MKPTTFGTVICQCPVCGERLPVFMGSAYVIHMIDDHWELVTRIHETTGDPDARNTLVAELAAEMTGSK